MAKQQLVSDLLLEDDVTISLSDVMLFNEDDHDHHDHDQNFPIPDEKYAEEFQFQEALMASLITSQKKTASSSSSSPSFIITENSEKQEPEMGSSSSSSSPSSSTSRCFCEICAEKKQTEGMFNNNNNNNNKCAYSFCTDCIIKHISIRVQHNKFINSSTVSCPGFDCLDHVLELEACSSFLPKQVIEEWDEALCESAIFGSDKFYCPFKDCSAMLIIDGEEAITQCECPICHRLFCATCYIPWHSGVDCEEFQRMNEDERGREDLMVKELAKEKNWKRCPHCKYYVEKTEGCLHITCRCNFQFCYACGSEWTSTHGGCQPN
ncbi:E3 ubiquitin-protein ligase RSL1 [Ziziphus jujuba]|uniref:RBR-type E3 ubiquitin transferase n=1 Tax=Ziziphus jujuba TaxID=326968 RepID=A0A6P4A1Y1_ZIZJJ|nr:E3 ubiquitin-protein ligase RSL1 [Ziziphus jujuba]